jgi:hypothetical protein
MYARDLMWIVGMTAVSVVFWGINFTLLHLWERWNQTPVTKRWLAAIFAVIGLSAGIHLLLTIGPVPQWYGIVAIAFCIVTAVEAFHNVHKQRLDTGGIAVMFASRFAYGVFWIMPLGVVTVLGLVQLAKPSKKEKSASPKEAMDLA